MKTILHILVLSLLGLQQAFAQNTVFGTNAGTTGKYSTHIGYYAGYKSTGQHNTFVGFLSGSVNTTASYNTFMGNYSGASNTTGQYNTFLGYQSGYYNSTGGYNTFVGYGSGAKNTTAYYNTFLGYNSGTSNTTGRSNTFLGHSSGRSNTSGGYNTFLGYNSGWSNTTGSFNTFLGFLSGSGTTTGGYNTFVGNSSGVRNTSGQRNIFLGYESGYSNSSGSYNIFLGNSSGLSNTIGSENTFLGYWSGYSNTTGQRNTFLGFQSGFSNTSGTNNVFIGYLAGYSETGSNKLYIDNNSDNNPLIYGNFASNVLSIGTKYTGTTYKLVIPGKVRATAYHVVSDERLKKDIQGLQDILAKVQKVEGVSYGFKDDNITVQDQADRKITNARTARADQQIHYGFLAQNIQQVFPELVTEDEGYLAVNYQGMIPVLVEAIKELSLQKDSVIQTLLAENLQMKQELMAMKEALQQHGMLRVGGEASSVTGSLLEQNRPNPFSQSTTIRYQVAAQARKISLIITNLQGVEVQRFDNLQAGQGQVEVAAGRLTTGTYIYTLVVDGQVVTSQKMILTQ